MTAQAPRIDEDWLHAMRNAVNAASLSVAATRSALESGDVVRACRFLDESEHACGMAASLLRGDVTAGAVAPPVTGPGPEGALHARTGMIARRPWRRPA